MADQGAIGVNPTLFHKRVLDVWAAGSEAPSSMMRSLVGFGRPIATWADDHRGAINIPVTGTLSGTVKENGAAKPYAWVALYYRKNGQIIARTKASESGAFSFSGLEPGVNQYYVIALGDGFNALVFDTVAAI